MFIHHLKISQEGASSQLRNKVEKEKAKGGPVAMKHLQG